MAVQKGWRWCKKCEVLFYAPAGNACPAGGSHDGSASACYLPFTAAEGGAQDKWRWCKRCGVMFYSGVGAGRCPGGGGHDASGSGQYWISSGAPQTPAQVGWKWCRNCQALFWGAGAQGVCPSGGKHDSNGSGTYGLRIQVVGEGVVVVHQGRGDDGTIWMSLRQNGVWTKNMRVPGGCSETPAATMHNGKLYIFYQGMGNCRELWYTTFDGTDFSASIRAGDIRLKGAPTAYDTDGKLEVWVQGTSKDVDLWRCWPTDIGKNQWHSELCDPRVSIWNDPAGLALPSNEGGGAWVFYERALSNIGGRGATGETWIYSTRHKKHLKISNHLEMRSTPRATWYDGRAYVFRESDSGNGEFTYAKLASKSDGADVDIVRSFGPTASGVRCSGGVAPVVDNRGLWVFFEGPGNSGDLYCIDSSNAVNWNIPAKKIDGVGVSSGCGAARFVFGA